MQLNEKTWIEINKANLLHNLELFKKNTSKGLKIMAVVKANAYGHGALEVVDILCGKVDFFAVDSIDEALEVRSIDRKTPILVMGYVPDSRLIEAIGNNISFVIYDLGVAEYVAKNNFTNPAKIHIKVETGLNRQGVNGNDLEILLNTIGSSSNKLELEGIYTHFADIEDTLDPTFAMSQLKSFEKELKNVRKIVRSGRFPLIHSAASAASMLYENSHFDMLRIGIGLYGLWPSKETKIELKLHSKPGSDLLPALAWRSVVAQVKQIKKGDSVGYGRTWQAQKNTKIAIVPVGYADGIDRKLSNNANVIINKQKAPVVGRVAMNMITCDVGHIKNIQRGDMVTIIGKDGNLEITADEIAKNLNTINYEVVARINPLILRTII